MVGDGANMLDELAPADAYRALETTEDAAMIDVRTRAEWAFTGVADTSATGAPLHMVEWVQFPDMAPNPDFLAQLTAQCGGTLPGRLLFICRSGARSMAAARLVSETAAARGQTVHCTNVAEGFEGDLDAEGHRGTVNGWKVHGLPWRQT